MFLSSNQWLGSLIKSLSSIIDEPGRQKLLAHSSNRCSHWTTWNCKDSGIRRAFVPWVLKIYILCRKGCCDQVFVIFHIGLDSFKGNVLQMSWFASFLLIQADISFCTNTVFSQRQTFLLILGKQFAKQVLNICKMQCGPKKKIFLQCEGFRCLLNTKKNVILGNKLLCQC